MQRSRASSSSTGALPLADDTRWRWTVWRLRIVAIRRGRQTASQGVVIALLVLAQPQILTMQVNAGARREQPNN